MTATLAGSAAAPTDRHASSAQFVRDAHRLVHDLMRENPRRYFTDFLISTAVAYSALAVYLWAPTFSSAQLAAFLVCGLGMYRAVVFTHEIAHRRAGTFRGFIFVWNALCGVPFFVPSFLYGDHKGHHSNQSYGTWGDPEYLLRRGHWRIRMAVFLLLPIVYPLLAFARFLLLTPVAFMSSRADRAIWTFSSSLYVMNESYRRDYDTAATTMARWVLELSCSCWAWLLVALVATSRLPLSIAVKVYFVTLLWVVINQVRTLAAHRYLNDPPAAVSYLDQLLDTNTFPNGTLLPALWAPVGLRYHALHHLFPMLPYHAMREAHCRLIERLPLDSPYHQTLRPGLARVLIQMWRDGPDPTRADHRVAAAIPTADRPAAR